MRQYKNILVRAPNWTGDVVMATPGLRALRAQFPQARITVQLRPGLEPLLAGIPWIDAVASVRSYHGGFRALFEEASALRAQAFDLGICLPDSFSSALLMRLAGIPEIVGYARGGRSWLLTQKIVAPHTDARGRVMLARELHVLGLIEALGAARQGTKLELFTTPGEDAEAESALARHGIDGTQKIVVFAPGAAYGPSKIWPPEYFAKLGDELIRQKNVSIVLVGSPSERALSKQVIQAMTLRAVNLVGEIPLGAVKAVLKRAALLVCNDAGARHIAVALGVPCLVLFGPTSIEKTNMNLEHVEVFTENVPCRPCYRRVCPIEHICLRWILPERLLAAALPLLSEAREARLREIAAQPKGEA